MEHFHKSLNFFVKDSQSHRECAEQNCEIVLIDKTGLGQ